MDPHVYNTVYGKKCSICFNKVTNVLYWIVVMLRTFRLRSFSRLPLVLWSKQGSGSVWWGWHLWSRSCQMSCRQAVSCWLWVSLHRHSLNYNQIATGWRAMHKATSTFRKPRMSTSWLLQTWSITNKSITSVYFYTGNELNQLCRHIFYIAYQCCTCSDCRRLQFSVTYDFYASYKLLYNYY